jgi:hypothetical protein
MVAATAATEVETAVAATVAVTAAEAVQAGMEDMVVTATPTRADAAGPGGAMGGSTEQMRIPAAAHRARAKPPRNAVSSTPCWISWDSDEAANRP